jgi:hypothetical protein
MSVYLSMALVDLRRFSSFLIYTVGRTPWDGRSARRKAATYTQNNTDTHASSGIRTHDPSGRRYSAYVTAVNVLLACF